MAFTGEFLGLLLDEGCCREDVGLEKACGLHFTTGMSSVLVGTTVRGFWLTLGVSSVAGCFTWLGGFFHLTMGMSSSSSGLDMLCAVHLMTGTASSVLRCAGFTGTGDFQFTTGTLFSSGNLAFHLITGTSSTSSSSISALIAWALQLTRGILFSVVLLEATSRGSWREGGERRLCRTWPKYSAVCVCRGGRALGSLWDRPCCHSGSKYL